MMVKCLEREVQKRLQGRRPGAINQKVERQVGAHSGTGRLDVCKIDSDGSAGDLASQGGQVVGRTPKRQNGRPSPGEELSGRATDTLGGSGDENCPSREFVRVVCHDDPSTGLLDPTNEAVV
jgi:hypothetical protein